MAALEIELVAEELLHVVAARDDGALGHVLHRFSGAPLPEEPPPRRPHHRMTRATTRTRR